VILAGFNTAQYPNLKIIAGKKAAATTILGSSVFKKTA